MGAFLGEASVEQLSAASGWTVHLTRYGNMRVLDIYASNTTCNSFGKFNCNVTVPAEDAPTHQICTSAFFDVGGVMAFFGTYAAISTNGRVDCALRGSVPTTSGIFGAQIVWAVEGGA